MVLFAVLRHPARDPEQAPWRHRARHIHHHSCVHAVARYVAGALGELPAALSAVPAVLLCRRNRAWLPRLAGTRRRLRDRCPHPDRLLLRVLLYHLAAFGLARDHEAAAEFDFGIGAAQGRPGGRIGVWYELRWRPSMSRPRNIVTALALASTLSGMALSAASAQEAAAPPRQTWSSAGPFGTYDPEQLQRGFKIYRA